MSGGLGEPYSAESIQRESWNYRYLSVDSEGLVGRTYRRTHAVLVNIALLFAVVLTNAVTSLDRPTGASMGET